MTLVSKLGKSILLREFQTYTTREEVRSIIGMHGFFNFFFHLFFFHLLEEVVIAKKRKIIIKKSADPTVSHNTPDATSTIRK